jgi:hypothetical protein
MNRFYMIFGALSLFVTSNLFAQTNPTDRTVVQNKIKREEKKPEEVAPDGWKKGGEGILNLSLTSFSKNWQAVSGGENNLLATGTLGLFANYKKDKFTWDNNAKLAYGFVNFIDRGSDNAFKIRKADDLILLGSKAGYGFSKKVYGVAFLDFATQFSPGYKYTTDSLGEHRELVSDLMSPATLRLGLGIDYRPTDYLSIMFAPVSFRGLFVNDQVIANKFIHGNGANDDGTGKTFTPEFGALLQAKFKKDLATNINLESNLDLFQNYLNSFDGTYLTWANILSLKVNKYIATRLESTLLYNSKADTDLVTDGIQTGLQHRLFLGVGFSYKF